MRYLRKNWAQLLTAIYLFFVVGYISNPKSSFWSLKLNEIGDFFAGIVGPVALLWLVRGYLQQNEAIRIQSRELTAAVDQHRAQVAATNTIAEHEVRHARIDYYRLVSEGSGLIWKSRLLLLGDTETDARVEVARKNSSPLRRALAEANRQQQAALQAAIRRLMERLATQGFSKHANQAAPIDILKSEIDEIAKSQAKFEAALPTLHLLPFPKLEQSFRDIVLHNGNAKNLMQRIELYIQLKETAEKQIQSSNSEKTQTEEEGLPPINNGQN